MTSTAGSRDPSLDALRGIAIVLVLIAHLTLFGYSPTSASVLQAGLQMAVGMFYKVITQVTVPTFYLVSLYLYLRKRRAAGGGYFFTRMRRLLAVTGVWLGAQYAAYFALHRSVPLDLRTLRLGGPSLYGAEASVFYFLTDLVMIVLVVELLVRLAEDGRARGVTWLAWAGLAGSLAYFAWCTATGRFVDHWLLVNFVPYVAVSVLEAYGDWRTPRWLGPALLAAGVALEVAWVLRTPGASVWGLDSYARLSVVGATLTLWRSGRDLLGRDASGTAKHGAPAWLVLAGTYSLGIYALHDFWKYGFSRVLEPIVVHTQIGTFSLNLWLALAVVACTVATVWLIGRTPLRWAVR